MTNLDEVLNAKELPRNKEFWLEVNERLKAVGLPQLIITDNAVYKDQLHAFLGIGYEIESSGE